MSSISLPLASCPTLTAVCIPGVIWGLWGRLIKATLQVKLPNWNDYVSCNLTPVLGAGTTPEVIHGPFASEQVTHPNVAKAFPPE